MNTVLTLLSLVLGVLLARGSDSIPVPLGEESELRLEGGSTIRDWSCSTGSLEAWVRERAVPQQGPPSEEAGELKVPVASLDCGDGRMEADLQEAVRASEHPTISFVLTDWELAPEEEGFQGVAQGRLTLAGVTRDVEVAVQGEPDVSGGIRAVGRTDLLMTSFGIRPPSAFFGLIKAQDRVEVHVDLRADAPTVERLQGLHAGLMAGAAGRLPSAPSF